MGKIFGSVLGDDEKSAPEAPLFSGQTEKRVSDIEGLVIEGRNKLGDYEAISDTPLPLSEISSFEVKEFLRERIGQLSIEGTINEMYVNIKNMEVQLRKVLDINASLENDLKLSKSSLIKTAKENERLKDKVRKMEDEGPLKDELNQELNQLLDEQHKTRETLQDIQKEKNDMAVKMNKLIQEGSRLNEEKDDALKDAAYIQSKADELVEKVRNCEEQIKELKGENLYSREKIKTQEEEISDLVEERNAIQMELKECKEAFDEIYDALIETKIKTKKFFYQELKEQEA